MYLRGKRSKINTQVRILDCRLLTLVSISEESFSPPATTGLGNLKLVKMASFAPEET